ncbi:Oidioi.mRNA.OKI2018_I69.chr2.g4932.t1.cds [Oikopleura dioica]|uniref:Oidioi.mRNA.OKI2018_I69.chr2.g4932.t1.cds n=1 Tax=Oikopleura dioica TaxID=34765 RepID=A0ABN7T2L9_OIKDI|nr:Oidioi.mRNA.OKI2018_I69.chr2.g4932.t1.cds [Oikopleura dioica]
MITRSQRAETMEVNMCRRDINQRWGITIKDNFGETVVTRLTPGSLAANCGLELYDVITHVNGTNVKTHSKNLVLEMLRETNVLSIKIYRGPASKKPPVGDIPVYPWPGEDQNGNLEKPKIGFNAKTKEAKASKSSDGRISKRGRPKGTKNKKKGPKVKIVKKNNPPRNQDSSILDLLELTSDEEDRASIEDELNDDVSIDLQVEGSPTSSQRARSRERTTSQSSSRNHKKKSRKSDGVFMPLIPFDNGEDPYEWDNPYKTMGKNSGAAINLTQNSTEKNSKAGTNPLDLLGDVANLELEKMGKENEEDQIKALKNSLLEQEIVIDELKEARLAEQQQIKDLQADNKRLSRALKALQGVKDTNSKKVQDDLNREKEKISSFG